MGLECKSPFHRPAWFVLSSGKPTPLPAGANSWKRRRWNQWLSGLTWSHLLGQWRSVTGSDSACSCPNATCLPPDSPASRSAKPESGAASKMSDGSGRPSGAPLASWDRATCSWKMSQASLMLEDSGEFSGTYPRSGSMRSGTLYPRQTQARITSASGYSSSRGGGMMPTPDANAWKGANLSDSGTTSIHSVATFAARLLNTPCASDAAGSRSTKGSKRQGEGGIRQQMLRTPNTRDHHPQGPRPAAKQRQVNLSDQARQMLPTPRAEDSQAAGSHRGAMDSLLAAARMMATPTTWLVTGKKMQDAHTSGTDRRKRREMLATPNTADAKGGTRNGEGQMQLCHQAREMMATPQAHDWKSGKGYDHGDKPQTPQLRHQSGGMLDPRPVEWMMGLPKNWVKSGGTIAHTHQASGSAETSPTGPSNSARLEMELYLSRQRSLLRYLLEGRG